MEQVLLSTSIAQGLVLQKCFLRRNWLSSSRILGCALEVVSLPACPFVDWFEVFYVLLFLPSFWIASHAWVFLAKVLHSVQDPRLSLIFAISFILKRQSAALWHCNFTQDCDSKRIEGESSLCVVSRSHRLSINVELWVSITNFCFIFVPRPRSELSPAILLPSTVNYHFWIVHHVSIKFSIPIVHNGLSMTCRRLFPFHNTRGNTEKFQYRSAFLIQGIFGAPKFLQYDFLGITLIASKSTSIHQ